MDDNKVQSAFISHLDSIPETKRLLYKSALENADDSCYENLMNVKLKNRSTVTLLSVFLGSFAIDRFYLGDIALGVLKIAVILLSPILFVVLMIGERVGVDDLTRFILFYLMTANLWWFIDIFVCRKRIKEKNFRILMSLLS